LRALPLSTRDAVGWDTPAYRATSSSVTGRFDPDPLCIDGTRAAYRRKVLDGRDGIGHMRKVVLITGMQAAGKSTIAPLLGSRLGPPAATLDGDVFFHGVVAGAVGMTPDPDPEAIRQLELRYAATAKIAQHYADAGFDFTCSDIILGDHVEQWFNALHNVEPHLVVLVPSVDSIVDRELGRGSTSYTAWQDSGATLADAVRALQKGLNDTPRRGLWLDTTDQTPEQTVEAILENDLKSSLW
jgi:chloramphenicol 3-O-phosphotransferase